jgi:hypothetical protein
VIRGPPRGRPDLPQSRGGPVELDARPDREVRWEAQSEAVAREAWKHVEVHVEHLLAGGLPVREGEVHALAAEFRFPQRRRRELPDARELGAVLRIEVARDAACRRGTTSMWPVTTG